MRNLTGLIILTLSLVSTGQAQAAPAVQPPSEPTLAVVGNGLIERQPDLARLSVDIVTNDDSAARSTSLNNDRYNALVAKLNGLLDPSAIRTSGFNLTYVPRPAKMPPPEQQQARYGYITTRSLQLTIVPIDNVGKVIDAATAAGATDIGGIGFDLKDRSAPFRDALAAAIADARADAQAIAAAGGLTLGPIVSITTSGASTPRTFGPAYAAALTSGTPTQIGATGPIQISAQVTVTYALR